MTVLKEVDYLDLHSFQWHKAPPLNEARYRHASIGLGEHIYVFGGNKSGSTERLLVGQGQAWKVILQGSETTQRNNPAVAALNDHSIVVFGGSQEVSLNQTYLNTGFVFDTKSCNLTQILGQENDIKFSASSLAQKVNNSLHVVVGDDSNKNVHMVGL